MGVDEKMIHSKKAAIGTFGITMIVIVGFMFAFGFGGIIKFLLTDKTPIILLGLFIFLLLFSQKKRQQRR